MDKVKLLIVSVSLAQGGNERWIYEICKTINKEKFEIGILCSRKYLYTTSESDFSNYYYHEIKKLDIPVYEYLDDYIGIPKWKRVINKINRKFDDIFHRRNININSQIIRLLQSYDVICVIDSYNFIRLKSGLQTLCNDKFFIVLHTHKVQLDFDPYTCFDKNNRYKFAYHSQKQIKEIAGSGLDLEKNEFFYCPLTLDLSEYPYLFNPIQNEKVIISVFGRVAFSKSIDMLIEAFAKAQQRLQLKSVLNIYGEIIDEEYYQHLCQLIITLRIDENSVNFMGHAQSIADTIEQDALNIYWEIINNGVLGYGSIEVGAMGVPTIFWDVDESVNADSILEQTNNSLIINNQMEDFVAANLEYINNNELLAELSKKQRDYIISKHHIANSIKDFESYVASIKSSADNP